MNSQLEAKVYSIWPEELVEQRAWMRYVIPAGSPSKPGELLVKRALTAKKYIGNQHWEDHWDDAIVIANDIANSASGVTGWKEGERSFGVWVSTEDGPPSEETIRQKVEERDALMRFWLRDGDKLFEDGKSAQIHRLSRVACDILQENRPWHKKASSGSIRECPLCGSNTAVGKPLCQNCKQIIDQELYDAIQENIKLKAAAAKQPPPPVRPLVRVPAETTA